MEPTAGGHGMSTRSPLPPAAALRVDRMKAKQTGERTGSRPQPPEAVPRSASLEPGRSPGYPFALTHAEAARGHQASLFLPFPAMLEPEAKLN